MSSLFPKFSGIAFPLSILVVLLPHLLCAGSRHPPIDEVDVQVAVEDRIGLTPHRGTIRGASGYGAIAVADVLRKPLTKDDALRIALVQNPSVQATYERLGVARADVLQASLLQNPNLEVRVRFPDEKLPTNREYALTQNILDLFLRPLRRRVAEEEFEEEKLRVTDSLLGLVYDISTAYFTLQGTTNVLALQRTVTEAAEVAAELSQKQYQVGNIGQLELSTQQATYAQARLELSRTEIEVATARERLARLMGLSGQQVTWQIQASLPPLPPQDPKSDELEAMALRQRLDLAASRQEVKVLQRSLAVTRNSVLGAVNLGIDTEQAPEGFRVTGPTIAFDLPIFDQQQAKKARLRAKIRQEGYQAEDLVVAIRSEVRLAFQRLTLARNAIDSYHKTILPLQAQIVNQSQKSYNFMLIGAYTLLVAKQNELMVQRDSIRAQLDYWLAWTSLEKAVAGHLPKPDPLLHSTEATAPTTKTEENNMSKHGSMHHHTEVESNED